jgi:hypothetical protein
VRAARQPQFEGFPKDGETANITFSSLKVEGNKMSYEWQGTVAATASQ